MVGMFFGITGLICFVIVLLFLYKSFTADGGIAQIIVFVGLGYIAMFLEILAVIFVVGGFICG